MKPILFLIIISAIFYGIWRWNSPYPYALNWDIWEHQTVVNTIRGGSLAVNPSILSDTFRFNGYTTAFHVFIALVQQVFQTKNILGFWWIAEGVFFALTTIAMYFLAYALTKNRLASLMAGVLSAGFFESSMAYTTLFLIPQTLAALIWVIGIIWLTTTHTHETRMKIETLFALGIVLLHGVVGIFGGVLLFLYAFALHLRPNTAMSLGALALGYLVPTFIASRYPVGSINAGEALYFTQTVSQKLALFTQWYGFLPIPFLILGLWKSHTTSQKAFVLLTALALGVMLSPFPYILKFAVYTHYLMIGVMAVGLAWLVKQFHSAPAKGLSLLMITIAVGLIFTTNSLAWQKPVLFHGIASQVSGDEQRAASALKSLLGQEAFLVSDPATQYIMEALSGVNSQGGAYMIESTRAHIIGALESPDQTQFVQHLSQIDDLLTPAPNAQKLLVVSGRTFKWLESPSEKRNSITYNIWRPEALSLDNALMIETWKERFGLQEVYRNASVVILVIKTYDTK